ncbi:glucose-6-phosphate isomerase family protein [Calderihabitans maritimus]|nr:glucose-6-phosphate isomerase family protein [Calderihabitans maritimus]
MIFGKDFGLTEEGQLVFYQEDIYEPKPAVRRLIDAGEVLFQTVPLDDRPLYYMYRGVHWRQDREKFLQHDIRYDITVILPGLIGQEYIKTVGHFHPLKPQSSETYPEYYEVLSGEALYLLQKNNRRGEVEEVLVVEAKKGDKVYIPPGYGHITINPGNEPLVMANLVEANFSSIYEPFAAKRGAAYYYIQNEKGQGEFVKNPYYQNSVALRMVAAPNLPQPTEAVKNASLYGAFIQQPEAFEFLK